MNWTRNAVLPGRVTFAKLFELSPARAFDLAAVLLCLVAWLTASKVTSGLTWPCENDLFRDLSAAQSILDGQGGVDPSYLGERRWYNPLVPALVAFTSQLFNTPLHEAYARFGAELNLFAPAAFYALVSVLFNRGAALASLMGFLFLGPRRWPSWLHATYSPWLWPCNFAQGLFYLSVLVWVWALRRQSRLLAAASGAAMGLTVLAHAAPALLLLGVIAVTLVAECVPSRATFPRRSSLLAFLAIAGLTAIAVGWPFLREWLLGPRVLQNPVPLTWLAGELTLQNWRQPLAQLGSLRAVLSFVGVAALLAAVRQAGTLCGHSVRAVLGWGLFACLGLAYGYAAQRLPLPPLLPSWHFFFYLQALQSVFFGLGVVALASLVESRLASLSHGLTGDPSRRQWQYLATAAAILAAFLLTKYRGYAQRADLVANRAQAITFAASPVTELYAWLLENTQPSDVVLAEGPANFQGVFPAGRKLVALPDLFSNPFVDVERRAADANALYAKLKAGEAQGFHALAEQYRIQYVVLEANKRATRGQRRLLTRVLRSKDREQGLDVYRIADRASP